MKQNRKKKDETLSIVKASRKKSREEEIALYGKQICFRTLVKKNPKAYNRNREKRKSYDNSFSRFLFL